MFKAGTVFHGTARVQELSFTQNLDAGKTGKGDLDERRTPNLIEQPETCLWAACERGRHFTSILSAEYRQTIRVREL